MYRIIDLLGLLNACVHSCVFKFLHKALPGINELALLIGDTFKLGYFTYIRRKFHKKLS